MNPNPGDHWRGAGGPPQSEPQSQGRPFASFGPNGPAQPAPHVLPPPSPYHQHRSQPSGSHSLSIADLTQGPPNHQQGHQYNTAPPPPQSQSHPMGGSLGHSIPQHSPQYLGRDREIREHRERELREHEMRERERSSLELQQRQREDMIMREREREAQERDRMERLHQEQQRPVQSHAGSIPIHQPVANKVQNTIHGPNGLLANGGAGALQQNGPGPSVSSGLFGGAVQHEPQRQPQYLHQQPPAPGPQPSQSFMPGPSPMPANAQMAHGQQPILNDALSYLDQVKVRFNDQPDVYNRFLDIMKDFKSQAIDTPGVIERVSNLFNGHPALIQGFNTFLPPGYRIECGTEENPDAIRVTTPSGTMTQSLQTRGRALFEPAGQAPANRQDPFESRHGWGQPLGASPSARSSELPGYKPTPADEAANVLAQEQRGVSTLQSAVTAVTNGTTRSALAVSPGPGQGGAYPQQGNVFGGGAGAGEMKRGGPVEFNHAISYVNKIKTRFAPQPEIYKQFLEILQTYQRESKPIQDVYAQVTQLFLSAPDLLEDFKQFLPESAAHGKAQAARAMNQQLETSDVRGEPGYTSTTVPQAQTPRPTSKMPPMGQFDPPSTSKDNKKRRGGPGATTSNQSAAQPASESTLAHGSRTASVQVGNASKRPKLATQRQAQPEVAVLTSPTLVPQLPEPLPPLPSISTSQEELAFFDRAKKQIGNRASYAEFLKLLNLYTQDLIDKFTLGDRVGAFIGGSPELMNWFKSFLHIEEQEEVIEARARPDPGRVNLARCRAMGPSYRHLPKRDQDKPCKGRDGMCYEVLNDVWASHPTWASEDSGFVAHRKNQYEEALHRIEEERHDYDFHIESCQRTIQLMEPIVQQITVMNEADRAGYQLSPGLGGASEAIPKRIIMKIYGREAGAKVIDEMLLRPTAVLPIVLSRLKQKLEEWKQVQREWEKVWRDQIHRQFWKSLDHQGLNSKNQDKKNFQLKTLTGEIQTKYEEDKKNRDDGIAHKKHQLEYKFDDLAVVADATRLMLIFLESDRQQTYPSSNDQERVRSWLIDFLVRFYGVDFENFSQQVQPPKSQRDVDEMADGHDSDSHVPSRTKHKGRSDFLRRQALERRQGREDSLPSASKESTPAPGMESEMDIDEEPMSSNGPEEPLPPWINVDNSDTSARRLAMDETYPHTTFNLYANANIYCFFRLFEMLYSRLLAIKLNEANVREAVARYQSGDGRKKPAIDLRMIDKGPESFFYNVGDQANYYRQILTMCHEAITGATEINHLEETLRRYYNKSGWQLYTIDRLVGTILASIWKILSGDPKDKSLEITNLFLKDRDRPDTTRKQEIQYRKQVERLSKDAEVYRISYVPDDHTCTIRLFPPEDATFDNDSLTDEAQWQYYIASYTMTDATEGVDQSKLHWPYLRRNIAPQNAHIETAYQAVYGNIDHVDDQTAFISLDTYKLLLQGDYGLVRKAAISKAYESGRIEESEKFREKFVRNTAWMRDQRAEDVERKKAAWEGAKGEGFTGYDLSL